MSLFIPESRRAIPVGDRKFCIRCEEDGEEVVMEHHSSPPYSFYLCPRCGMKIKWWEEEYEF